VECSIPCPFCASSLKAQRVRLRATRQDRNLLLLRVARLILCPFCASSSKRHYILCRERLPYGADAGAVTCVHRSAICSGVAEFAVLPRQLDRIVRLQEDRSAQTDRPVGRPSRGQWRRRCRAKKFSPGECHSLSADSRPRRLRGWWQQDVVVHISG
jgi:hypothetical protein